MFKNAFSFNGRIRRLEFGISYLIYLIVYLPIIFAIEANPDMSYLLLLLLPLIWFLLAQGAKRCHDRDNSGWYQIIPFYSLWMLFADGFPGKNQYGLNPKGVGNNDDIQEIGVPQE
ncbi:DUF805 domain-containing protein [Flavobacterium sp. F372]|jgi:uncharacterized membrane protein YhaH (DUF805 family)|uniref:DUF805 domain-containing protein n=1 Tax=Flavobacterium bernardetii TaxID=2813823 RepID=A0ABR7IX33_9FLAO|nr:DUF805 domain-containing protein [Flavobacterium bernardetii]MBC5834288.1 DUF805 domain-containing protein [Flavobacterium bernardetii]NHF70073.1 DUF805 domain-containing protein [Flavobacterium bernardetii]